MQLAESIGATADDIRRAQTILDSLCTDAITAIGTVTSPVVLHLVAANYNWNDGFDVPFAILRSSVCDRGTALMLFWLASPEKVAGARQAEFVTEARQALSSPSLKTRLQFNPSSFFGWNRLYRHKLEQAGFPTILLDESSGLPSATSPKD